MSLTCDRMNRRKYWAIADTHFNHKNILTFKGEDGQPTRPFDNIDDMNHTIIQRWNESVAEHDNVYVLGDVFFGSKGEFTEIWKQLKGRKTLIVGNHDNVRFLSGTYKQTTRKCKTIDVKYFRDIELFKAWGNLVMSHTPLHLQTLGEDHRFGEDKTMYNVHGHIHTRATPDPSRYKCVSVEQTNYRPVDLNLINNYFKNKTKWDKEHFDHD